MSSTYPIPIVLNQIPVLNVRGTHSIVGYSIGRTFKGLIHDVLQKYGPLEQSLLPSYAKPQGRQIYDHTLTLCQQKFPGYVQELEGIAHGSDVPFYKLFLLHIENHFINEEDDLDLNSKTKIETGCSSLLSWPKKGEILLGHTEDAGRAIRNNIFVVSAEIENEAGEVVERFSTLTYAAYLPGSTMGFNHFGIFHSINALVPIHVNPFGTPIMFIMRGLLAVKNLAQAHSLLMDAGSGAADGFGVNLIYSPTSSSSSSSDAPVVQNIEISPGDQNCKGCSRLDIRPIEEGSSYAHCNRYLRGDVPQHEARSYGSVCRHRAIDQYPHPYMESTIKSILSDQSDPNFPVFRDEAHSKDYGITVAAGSFNIKERTWSLYTGPPESSAPVVTIPLPSAL